MVPREEHLARQAVVDRCVTRSRFVGWSSTAIGALSGLIMGLWSFDGPAAVPAWLGDYGETSRRLARLGHIAFFGLGMLNLLMAGEFRQTTLGERGLQWASKTIIFGNLFLPLTLFAAAVYHPLKYLMPFPALSVLAAMMLMAFGAYPRRNRL